MTEAEVIKAALALKEFCSLRGCCSNGKKDVCPFLDTHNKKNLVCRISERFPASWDVRGLKNGEI